MFFTFITPPVIIESGDNMNKAIPSLVIGIIFSLIGAVCAYLSFIVLTLIGAFTSGTIKVVCTVVPFINMGTYAFAFIGSILCAAKPKIGGIITIISAMLSIVCLAIIFITLKAFEFTIVLLWLPTIFILIAGIIAITKRPAPQLIQEEKQN